MCAGSISGRERRHWFLPQQFQRRHNTRWRLGEREEPDCYALFQEEAVAWWVKPSASQAPELRQLHAEPLGIWGSMWNSRLGTVHWPLQRPYWNKLTLPIPLRCTQRCHQARKHCRRSRSLAQFGLLQALGLHQDCQGGAQSWSRYKSASTSSWAKQQEQPMVLRTCWRSTLQDGSRLRARS